MNFKNIVKSAVAATMLSLMAGTASAQSSDQIKLTIYDWTGLYATTHIMGEAQKGAASTLSMNRQITLLNSRGINQTIMMALSKLVITALVGTRNPGQEVYVALTKADIGHGLVAGVSIV